MRFYYGWWIVAIGFVILFLVIGSTMQSFGVYVIPVSEDYGLSRADANTALILVNLGVAAVSPIVGRMIDIFPIRRIMIGGAILFGGSLALLGLLHSLQLSAFILAVPLAIGIAASGTLTAMALVARWFDANRGRAMALLVMGMSLGTVVMAPLIGWLIEQFGWRQCVMLLGVVLGGLFLVLAMFARERPGPDDIEPGSATESGDAGVPIASDSIPPAAKPLGIGQLLSMPIFWVLSLGAALAFGSMQAMMVSIVPMAGDIEITGAKAASLMSIVGVLAVVGKLVLVWLGDKFDKSLVLGLLFGLIAASSVALMFAHDFAALAACSALLGLSAGATMPIFLALLAQKIGPASFGTANGVASLMMALMGAVAVRFGGEVYDRTGGYDMMFMTFTVVAFLSAAMIFATGRMGQIRAQVAPAE